MLYDPKSSLIVAGAGAGKTLTICGKVKYLLDNKFCSPDEILLLSYSSASANDLAEKVEKINNRISPIQDDYIEKYLAEKELELVATLDGAVAYKDAEFVVIAAPTNYDPKKNFFDYGDAFSGVKKHICTIYY